MRRQALGRVRYRRPVVMERISVPVRKAVLAGRELDLIDCPGCGETLWITPQQAGGFVSVWHDKADGGCGFHRYINDSPYVVLMRRWRWRRVFR